jgi:hypothetical protein
VRQRGVLQVGVDLLDDRVPAVGLVGGDGVEVAGGEERVLCRAGDYADSVA